MPDDMTLRMFLIIVTMERAQCTWPVAAEAVSSTVMAEHPEWDLAERRTWDEWVVELRSRERRR